MNSHNLEIYTTSLGIAFSYSIYIY